jgi:hypothetical protein
MVQLATWEVEDTKSPFLWLIEKTSAAKEEASK